MIKEALNEIKDWFKDHYKFIIIIFLYFLYMNNVLLYILYKNGININKLSISNRIIYFTLNDLIYICIIIFLFKEEIINGLKDIKQNFTNRLITASNCWIVGCIIMIVSSIIISKIVGQNISTNEEIIRKSIKVAPFYMLFSCSLVAPIFEEFVFRRSIKGFINNKWIYILISGISFGLLHIINNNPKPLEFLYIIPYGSMGCCFAYLYSKTKNISLPIIVHMIHNTVLVLVQIIGG